MKKILIASLFIFGMGAIAQAQTTDKTTEPSQTANAAPATKAEAKSCCAGMADASKKECTDTKTAEAANAKTATTDAAAEAPKAACSDKAAASSCCAGKAVASNQEAPAKLEEKKTTAAPAVQ